MKKIFLFIFFITMAFSLYTENIRFVWWNVKNFFDTVDDPHKDDTVLAEEEYRRKLLEISTILKDLDADVAGLTEVENFKVLSDLAEQSGYKYFYLKEGNDPRGIDVCLLSNYKAEYNSNKDIPTPYKFNVNYKFSRDCPEAVIKINDKTIYILLNHLKSNFRDEEKSRLKRIAQANGILDIVSSIYKENSEIPNILVMGDFNSVRNSEPLNILSKSGLLIINYKYNEKNTYTFRYKKENMDLDYFIINKELYDKIKIRKFKSIKITDQNISDHNPLVFEIEL